MLDLPGLLAYPLFYKLVEAGASVVSREVLLDWMRRRNVLQASFPLTKDSRWLQSRYREY